MYVDSNIYIIFFDYAFDINEVQCWLLLITIIFVFSGDQSSLTPLQQAKKAICDVIQTLEETDAKEIGKWLKQSSFWENDDFSK